MTDINGKPILIGQTLIDKWGEVGQVVENNHRTHWRVKETSYWLCQAIIDTWELEIYDERAT
jgi:hypothetical protein